MKQPEIIKAALLGTDRFLPDIQQGVQDTIGKIQMLDVSKEDRFLKMAFTTLVFHEAGAKPPSIDTVLPECTPETQEVAGDKITTLAHAALKDRNQALLDYYLYRIRKSGRVMQSWLVPTILDKALETGGNLPALMQVCGQVGQWLCQLNPRWNALSQPVDKDINIWETGTFEQRKTYVAHLRKTTPQAAIALLEASLAEESAGNRLIFTQLLSEGLSLADEPFLHKLTLDKSQKVKDAAFDLLKQIPGSALNEAYVQTLARMLEIREERHLLITKKKTIAIRNDVLPDDSLFRTGIEKVSREKGVEDHVYQAAQMMAYVNPATLSIKLNVNEQQLISLLLDQKSAVALIPFLSRAAILHSSKTWSMALLHREEALDIRLLNALGEAERLAFYGKFLNNNLAGLLSYVFDEDYSAIPMKLADNIIDHLSRFPYQITPAFYHRLALHLPIAALAKLKVIINDGRQDYQLKYFKTQASEMVRISELIQQID